MRERRFLFAQRERIAAWEFLLYLSELYYLPFWRELSVVMSCHAEI